MSWPSAAATSLGVSMITAPRSRARRRSGTLVPAAPRVPAPTALSGWAARASQPIDTIKARLDSAHTERAAPSPHRPTAMAAG